MQYKQNTPNNLLLDQITEDPNTNATATKLATTFNTNRTYINEAAADTGHHLIVTNKKRRPAGRPKCSNSNPWQRITIQI